jgi:hypothetical protein
MTRILNGLSGPLRAGSCSLIVDKFLNGGIQLLAKQLGNSTDKDSGVFNNFLCIAAGDNLVGCSRWSCRNPLSEDVLDQAAFRHRTIFKTI